MLGRTRRIPILAYHAIALGDAITLPSGWSRPHTVSYFSFLAQLDFLKNDGWKTVGFEAIGGSDSGEGHKRVVITLDDGHASDTIAAEALARHGFRGIFFVPWSHVGRKSYLEPSAVQELIRSGFGIGSHGLTHAPLTGRDDAELQRELVESKQRLEDLTGTEVTDLALPFGRYDRRVIAAALAAGYQRIATSDIGIARVKAAGVLPRLPITAATRLEDFCALLSARPVSVMWRRMRQGAGRRLVRLKGTVLQARQRSR